MSLGIVLVFPLTTVFVLLTVVLIAVPRRRRLVAINEHDFPGLARLRSASTSARIVGLVVGLMVVVPLTVGLRFGLGVFLAPAVFAATQILATLAAGIITHDAARSPGISGLEVRRIRPYLPKGLTGLTVATTVALAIALAWTTATAEADDMGNVGRAVSFSYPCNGECAMGTSPWPGSFYSIPIAVLFAIVSALALATIIVIVRRPRNGSDPEIVRVDDLVRARAVETIVAAVGAGSAVTLLGVSFLVANFLGNPGNPVPILLRVPGWGAVFLTVGALAMGVWCVVILLLPGATAPFRHSREAEEEPAVMEA